MANNLRFIKESKRSKFTNEDGIFCSKISAATTVEVSGFYSQAPFPNYNGYENKLVLAENISNNAFLHDIKQYLGHGKTFIEVGSGTCQLSIGMAVGTNNLIVAMDPTIESLTLGKDFAAGNNVNNVQFLNADIFDDDVQDNFFDIVWCSGVLHHTEDSKRAFKILSNWAKPDGLIIVGVYNKIGRLRTNFRQALFRLAGKSEASKKIIHKLDPHLRKELSKEKRQAWFRDQYEHPLERKHSLDEVIQWFEETNVTFMGSIPCPRFKFRTISQMDGFKGSYLARFISQVMMLFSNLGGEGGLCIVVGKKK